MFLDSGRREASRSKSKLPHLRTSMGILLELGTRDDIQGVMGEATRKRGGGTGQEAKLAREEFEKDRKKLRPASGQNSFSRMYTEEVMT